MSNVINFNNTNSKNYIDVYLVSNVLIRLPVTEESLQDLKNKLDRNKLKHIITGEIYINAQHIIYIDFMPTK